MSDPAGSIERGGIKTTRRHTGTQLAKPNSHADLIDQQVTESGARTTMTVDQAHEALDQLAYLLGRPDLIALHRLVPAKRTQPGTPQATAAVPRPPAQPKELRNYDH